MSRAQVYGPYSPLRSAGPYHYISGQVGVNPENGSAAADAPGQADQALRNMAAVLSRADLTMNDVVKTTVYLTDMADFAAVNAVYEQHFTAPRPARAAVAVRELPRVGGNRPLVVEIDAIAYKEPRS